MLVTLSSPSLQGTRTTYTSENGGYSFAALPPGEYKVTFAPDGMGTVTKTAKLTLSTQQKVSCRTARCCSARRPIRGRSPRPARTPGWSARRSTPARSKPGQYTIEIQLKDLKAPKEADGSVKSYAVKTDFRVE